MSSFPCSSRTFAIPTTRPSFDSAIKHCATGSSPGHSISWRPFQVCAVDRHDRVDELPGGIRPARANPQADISKRSHGLHLSVRIIFQFLHQQVERLWRKAVFHAALDLQRAIHRAGDRCINFQIIQPLSMDKVKLCPGLPASPITSFAFSLFDHFKRTAHPHEPNPKTAQDLDALLSAIAVRAIHGQRPHYSRRALTRQSSGASRLSPMSHRPGFDTQARKIDSGQHRDSQKLDTQWLIEVTLRKHEQKLIYASIEVWFV